MKRTLTNTAKVFIFLIGFIFAVYHFTDWGSIGKFAVSLMHSRLERMNMRMEYSDVSEEEDGFTIGNLTLNGTANVSFNGITIRPRILSSILSLSAVSDINFRGLSIRLGQSMNFGDGELLLTASGNEILFENLRTNGEFALNGYMSIDTGTMRIGRAEARIDVPESFKGNMGMLQNFMPLVQEGNHWYIRRR